MTGGIAQNGDPTDRILLGATVDLRTRCASPLNQTGNVAHRQMQGDRASHAGRGCRALKFRMGVGHHEPRSVDLELAVTDPPIGHHDRLMSNGRAENVAVPRERRPSIRDGEIRGDLAHGFRLPRRTATINVARWTCLASRQGNTRHGELSRRPHQQPQVAAVCAVAPVRVPRARGPLISVRCC